MQKKQIINVAAISMVVVSLSSAVASNATTMPSDVKATSTLFASGPAALSSASPNYNAIKWYRQSAERVAIYREVFQLGEQQIKQQVKQQHLKPDTWGVILDIDETALNNSEWFYRRDILKSKQSWVNFQGQARSTALPGVKEFTADIHQMGGYVTLISNRPNYLLPATRKNLINQHIYFDQVLLDNTNIGTSFVDKNPRFNAVVSGKAPSKLPAYKVLAWFGDNIQDFPHLSQQEMAHKNPEGAAYAKFGVTYFVLPNPLYGSWEQK